MPDQSGKKVRAAVAIGPNYAFHLMAVARIGFESGYADRYASSVIPEDLDFLRNHRDILTFGGGSTSELVAPIIAWPAYFNLDTREALKKQFDLLDRAFSSNDTAPFLSRYAPQIKKLEKWWYTINDELLKLLAPQNDLIQDLGRIVVRNFDKYRSQVWPKEMPRLQEVAADIDSHFDNLDRIGQWEKITGRTFEFDVYHIVLCSAIENGPNANSLGYDQVVFYSGSPRESMMQFISHEIGTHILIGMLKEVAAINRFEFRDLYDGYELLSRYYNTRLLGRTPLDYPMSAFHVAEYLDIYDSVYRGNPDLDARELLIKGIEAFKAR
jgi:hypothetical protein